MVSASKDLLNITGLSVHFEGLRALDGYSLQLEESEILGIIGPNGAGKTTLFNTVTGFIKPADGLIRFDSQELTALEPSSIAKAGIARTFQNICLFENMSVIDNVIVGGELREKVNPFGVIFNLSTFKKRETNLRERASELLKLFSLEKYCHQMAKNLSYGDRRRLEIARALATSPRLLLVDEPAAGMNPKETADLLELILFIKNKFDLTIILIEHNMNLVMPLCERIQVLNYGIKIAEGTPQEIQKNEKVIKAYLGEDTGASG
jgi:branched-chain amino acid transport system ATP-binding protein